MTTKLNARHRLIPLVSMGIPLLSVIGALGIGSLLLAAFGANPFVGYREMFLGGFGDIDAISDTLVKSIPLLLVGVGICLAFRTGVVNIGGEGQILAGAILSTLAALAIPNTPRVFLVPILLIVGGLGGAIWGAIPGALKAFIGVNEILSTIMMNIVAGHLLSFLLEGLIIEPGEIRIQQTKRLTENSDIPLLPGGTRLHFGIVVAVFVAVAAYVVLKRTTLGLRLRAVGHNKDAARYAGMSVQNNIVLALALSGACAGVAGALLVFGSESHRLIGEGGAAAFTQSAGFNGIVAALFGGLNPLLTIPASFLFGGMLIGGIEMQRAVQVPSALIIALNGIVVVFVVSSFRLKRKLEQAMTSSERDRA